MIHEAMMHLPGIGKKVMKDLHWHGIRDWLKLREHAHLLALSPDGRQALVDEIDRCETARTDGDLAYLTQALEKPDHWRILAEHFERASYFDIETSGMARSSYITLICCYHKNKLYRFFHGENMDDFLDFMDDVDLLISFNGNQFDVPRVEAAFHIPKIPCPHIDLRWVCHQQGFKGGLKSIEQELAIERPPDLVGVDGEEAVWLWDSWHQDGDRTARDKLERYCAADVISLKWLTARLLQIRHPDFSCVLDREIWRIMDTLKNERVCETSNVPMEEPTIGFGPDAKLEQRMQARWKTIKNRGVSA